MFEKLSLIALLRLSLSYSNAQEERVFNMIRKNNRSERSSFYVKGTLSVIMMIKISGLDAKSYQPSRYGGAKYV